MLRATKTKPNFHCQENTKDTLWTLHNCISFYLYFTRTAGIERMMGDEEGMGEWMRTTFHRGLLFNMGPRYQLPLTQRRHVRTGSSWVREV